ncbi:hypothetical protein Pmani_026929 [Petrolisthes manimaculis]|uniref:R-spondin Fu-CRD domain-containing protein n=1 Tax=Petrolisthes manimaculis TaxID=1843537 RepID=A0AAE1TZM5_9EUCA|nr:hypothetical protein Pmani_026929 [Petrolisthes manimaculis]
MEVGCGPGCGQCTAINGCVSCNSPYFLLLHRDGTHQTASCTRSCPPGFYKLRRRRKHNNNRGGFCAKCMLRGCRECSTRHYCSVCKTGLVRHAGRCRKRCPLGTSPAARAPGLCLPAPSRPPDLSGNEITVGNSSWPRLTTPLPSPSTNATTTTPAVTPTPTKKERKKKRRRDKDKKRQRHKRRKHKRTRLRNRRRKERRRRRMRQNRQRRRKKISESRGNVGSCARLVISSAHPHPTAHPRDVTGCVAVVKDCSDE